MIILLMIAALPDSVFSSKASRRKVEEGVERLKALENRGIPDIESHIEEVWAQRATKDTEDENNISSSEESDSQEDTLSDQTNVIEPLITVQPPTPETMVPINVEGTRIPLRIREGAVDYCADVDVKAYNYREIFADSVILGDSIAESISYYQVLDPSTVMAKIGASMRAADEQIDVAAGLNPKKVFIYFGLNDIEELKTNYDKYRSEYETIIQHIREKIPNAEIYANLLFSVIDTEEAGGPEYADLSPYNNIIIEVCEEYQVNCIDCTGIVKESFFEPDGCHFKYQFYPCWLYSMGLLAGLI